MGAEGPVHDIQVEPPVDVDDETMRDEDHPLWESEHIELTSVGIDIGSATSQLLFSQLGLHRMGRDLSSRYVVVSREVLHRSPVHLTPYLEGLRIDEQRLHEYVTDAFQKAGLTREEVDTGAIILTGEATRRENSRAIADMFAAESGSFVCATAGHHMEALLAAHGSGAVALSRRRGARVLNIDIGGGTTKYAVIDGGEVVETAALHIGGRLVAVDGDDRIIRLEPGGERVAALAGMQWSLGARVQPDELQHVADWMADAIVEAAGGSPRAEVADLFLTDRLGDPGPLDAVLFSGGVSEYIHGEQDEEFGDVGPALGRALRRRADALPGPMERTEGGILATVIGASQYTVQVSGNTIYVSDRSVLPLQNVRVVRPDLSLDGGVDSDTVAQAITKHLETSQVDPADDLAFAFRWAGPPSFQRLDAFASGLEIALAERFTARRPICLVFEGDIGRTMGALLAEDREHSAPIISVDGIELTDFEFIDVGRLYEKSGTVPISIKSLIFHL